MFSKKANKIKGFTLIETLFVLAIFATVSVIAIERAVESARIKSGEHFAKKLTDVVLAIDKRLQIEGYDSELWVDSSSDPIFDPTSTLDTTLVSVFIKEQLYTDNNPCVASSNWILDSDLVNNEATYGPIDCNIFPDEKYGLKIDNAKIIYETLPYAGIESIKKISIDFDITTSYLEYMKELTVAASSANERNIENVAGMHVYGFYDPSYSDPANPTAATGKLISAPQCLKNITDSVGECVFRAGIDTMSSDGSSYLKVSGQNKMMGNVAFHESPDDRASSETLKDCYVWYYDPNIDGWNNYDPNVNYDATVAFQGSLEVPCGLRYDSVSGTDAGGATIERKILNISGNNMTATDSIVVAKECDSLSFNKNPSGYQIDPLNPIPPAGPLAFELNSTFNCGIFKVEDGSTRVIALVEDVYAENVYAQEGNFKTLKAGDLTSGDTQINGTLSVSGITDLGSSLTVAGDTTIGGETNMIGNVNIEGVTNIIGSKAVITDKTIDEFTDLQEFVSKEYVDNVNKTYIAYVNNNHLSGDIINNPGYVMTPTRNGTGLIFCQPANASLLAEDEIQIVSPIQVHNNYTVLTYTVEKIMNMGNPHYRVIVVDGDGVENTTAKVNVVIFCKKQ